MMAFLISNRSLGYVFLTGVINRGVPDVRESSQSKARAPVLEPIVSMLPVSHTNCELGVESQSGNAFANFFESPLGYQLTLVSQQMVKYYVARGVHLGIHCSWVECKLQVNKFNGARN